MKKIWVGAAVCALLIGCGSDSSSSSDDEEEILSSSSQEEYVDPNDSEDYLKSKTTYVTGSVRDNSGYINTVQFKSYIWTTENASYNSYSTENVCYDEENINCSEYGRLYQKDGAEFACPSGFHVPSVDEWKALDNFRLASSEHDSILNFPYGGMCNTSSKGDIKCSGQDESAKYLTSSGKIYILKKGNKSSTFDDITKNAYYSLRCVSSTYIVNTKSDLPACNSSSNIDENYFVIAEHSNFFCTGSHWVDDFTDDCPSSSTGVIASYKDTTYICKSGYWQLATISDIPDECTEDVEGSLLLVNGKRYACEDEDWRSFTTIEDSLGYCNSKKQGTIDSLISGLKQSIYVCDTSGWRTAKIADYLGTCDSTSEGKTAERDSIGYVCVKDSYNETFSWKKLSKLEMDIGVCTSERMGEFDTTKADTLHTPYYCDSTGWRTTKIKDYGGECTELKEGKEINHLGTYYICRDSYWSQLSGTEAYLGICNEKNDGQIRISSKDKYPYICESSTWNRQAIEDIAGECNEKNIDKVIEYGEDTRYCSGAEWMLELKLSDYMYLGYNDWNKYAVWDTSTAKHCTFKNEGAIDSIYQTIGNDTIYYFFECDPYNSSLGGWQDVSTAYAHFGACDSTKFYNVKTVRDTTYSCRPGIKNSWTKVPDVAKKYGDCADPDVKFGTVVTYNDTSYICAPNEWHAKSKYEKVLGFCKTENDSTIQQAGDSSLICQNWNWVVLGIPESEIGFCTTALEDSVKEAGDYAYKCSMETWIKLSYSSYLPTCDSSIVGTVKAYGGAEYQCRNNKWNGASSQESALGFCTKDRFGKKGKYNNYIYQCDDYTWTTVSE